MPMRVYATRDRDSARATGFSLIETLVVLAIISILMAMLTTALTKAVRMAKSTAAGEEMRQEQIGKQAVAVHESERGATLTPEDVVQLARRSFRQVQEGGKTTRVVSTMLYAVENDVEFKAYWHTLLNHENPELPEFGDGGSLIAFTDQGERYELPPIGENWEGAKPPSKGTVFHLLPPVVGNNKSSADYPASWEYISIRLDETGRGDFGGNVIYGDGRREYVPYPSKFPMSRSVALLSHEYVSALGE